MAIAIPPDVRDALLGSVKRFFAEELETPVGDLKARLILDFAVAEIGPVLYNRGVADAQAWLRDRLEDLEGSCHEDESGSWGGTR